MPRPKKATDPQRRAAASVRAAADNLALAATLRKQADTNPAAAPANLALPSHEQITLAIEHTASQLLGFSPLALSMLRRALNDGHAVNVIDPTRPTELVGPDGAPILDPDGKPLTVPIRDEKARANNIKVRQQGLDTARDVLLTAGIIPSHTTSTVISNFFLGADAPGFAPILRQLLGLNETLPIPYRDGRVSVDVDFETVIPEFPD